MACIQGVRTEGMGTRVAFVLHFGAIELLTPYCGALAAGACSSAAGAAFFKRETLGSFMNAMVCRIIEGLFRDGCWRQVASLSRRVSCCPNFRWLDNANRTGKGCQCLKVNCPSNINVSKTRSPLRREPMVPPRKWIGGEVARKPERAREGETSTSDSGLIDAR
jgi:hypothetical protein